MITPIYPPYTGGASIYFSTLVKFLRDKVELMVLTTYHKAMPLIDTANGIKVFRVIPNIQRPALLRRTLSVLTSFITIFLIWVIYKPRILHSHYSGGMALGAGFFSLIFRVPIIKDVQGVDAFRSQLLFKSTIKIGNVRNHISCSEEITRRLLLGGIPEEKVITLPVLNPPVVGQIAEAKITYRDSDEIKVLFIGELTKTKGADLLLRAFKAIGELNNITLTCIGDGIEKENCGKFIKENSLERKVKLLGALPYEETLREVGNSDFLILPSQTEGIPRVILEAFAFEKAVIASNIGGIPEVVKDGETGILVEYGDVEALANAILRLSADRSLREKLGENGRNFLSKLPSWEQITGKILDMYHA